MKLWRFVLKNLFRNKRRTLLTVLSLGVSIFIVNTLVSVLRGLEATDPSSETHLRLITRSKVSLFIVLPEAYWEKIRQVPHVTAVTPWTWFGGVYKDQEWENQFARFSTDPESYIAVTRNERTLPEDQRKAWFEDRRGAIAGQALARRQGWKIGDPITIKGDIYPVDIELILRGIYTARNPDEEEGLFYHHMYLEELTGRPGHAGTYWLKVDAAENLPAVIKTIDAMFENSDAETLTETEAQFMADFVSMMGNIKGLLRVISLAVAVVILMLSANTMAMAVRERTMEVAVMKAIGFSPGRMLATILSESVLLGFISCVLGCLLSFLLFNLAGFRLPGLWTPMLLSPETAAIAAAVAMVVSLISGAIPGVLAARLSVADGLRRVV